MVSARALSPRAVDCAFSTAPDAGATCESFAASWGQSVDELKKLNPGITCPNLDDSQLYCVIGTVTADPTPSSSASSSSSTSTTLKTTTTTVRTTTTTTSTSSTSTSSSTTAAPAPSNSPQMPGLAANCDKFYKVASGDSCDTIASKNGITTTQFKTWNTEINAECSNLWLDYYVCVHVPGAAAPTTSTKTTSTTAAPAPTNSPQMPGLAANCDGFYKVASGDSCDTIASKNSITTTQFKSWNTEINAECSNLWLSYYVCVHVPGAVTQKPTTTTKPTSTTTAPAATNSPQMPGIVANCDGYHKIASGDQCGTIAAKYGITTDQFLSYNSYINAQCSNLWLDYYVCVHATPTPQMPGIVSNCKKYYQIKSGDSCWSIYSGAGITLDQFRKYNTQISADCSNLWLGYYVCTGV
ncbi:hypothetical protein SMACR_09586 [Sordaria macrospora]|uniref:LysM domain-containing protein n=1 Tax=Sordaria macrospora TaxID=5147 RepID=A0A8S8ZDV3_SORMA|nr:hypothetical protein SMACR_09586 [Sordaria macrospora]WPJ61651.1 hypothetical protein SMAC4_09586 [Sordaria macrospora]